jgi:hypothetical protein
MVAAAHGVRKKTKAPAGIPGDRYVVDLIGRQYYILDADTGLVMGGPSFSRERAQETADKLNANLGRLGRWRHA